MTRRKLHLRETGRRFTGGYWALLACAASIAAVWLVGLPEVGSRADLRRDMRRLESRGIDPRALFYDELESMRPEFLGGANSRKEHPGCSKQPG